MKFLIGIFSRPSNTFISKKTPSNEDLLKISSGFSYFLVITSLWNSFWIFPFLRFVCRTLHLPFLMTWHLWPSRQTRWTRPGADTEPAARWHSQICQCRQSHEGRHSWRMKRGKDQLKNGCSLRRGRPNFSWFMTCVFIIYLDVAKLKYMNDISERFKEGKRKNPRPTDWRLADATQAGQILNIGRWKKRVQSCYYRGCWYKNLISVKISVVRCIFHVRCLCIFRNWEQLSFK